MLGLYPAAADSFYILTTGPQPLPKRVLPSGRSRPSSFNFQYHLFSLRSPSSCLRLLPCLPVTSSLYLSFNNVFYKAVPKQDTHPNTATAQPSRGAYERPPTKVSHYAVYRIPTTPRYSVTNPIEQGAISGFV
jgi:hypothetical protein